MKFTLSWLKDHLDTQAGLDEILVALTQVGLEVEGVEDPAAKLGAFRIARVLTAERHPQADKLQVLSVDTGEGEPLQVVCGAPNARAGLVGVFGAPGTYVPGLDVTLKIAAIRGVESRGMMCSMRELELSDAHEGIIELPADAPVGASYAEWAGLTDPVIDVAITPNRQDCMGVRGIARDLAAAGLGELKPLDIPTIRGAFPCPVEIRTDDPEGCPAFFGRVVRGVKNGPSPEWLANRLKAIGQRPISALVDITNYVMFDHGRPLHVYDVATLKGALVARRAKAGESVLALNGKSYALDPEITVIADDAQVHDIGGIMGGEHSGVTEATTDVLIECAYFTPENIARTGQKLGLTSDARSRFERGVDPAFLGDGLAIATRLVQDLCGGEASDAVEAGEPPLALRTLKFDTGLTERLAGLAVSPDRQRAILAALGFKVDAGWTVLIPSWRRDVDGPADIVEEIVRIEGIDKVPSTPLPRVDGVARPTATPAQLVERKVRRAAAARGLNEAVTWSFVSEAEAGVFGGGAWTLANPISEELKVMRPSLLPGLIAAAKRNADRGAASIRLFEIGRRYLADAERPTLGFVLAGDRASRSWQAGRAQAFDAYDAKAEALAILVAAGAPVDRLQVMEAVSPVYHPGRSATLRLGPKTVLAEFGELHPGTARAFDVEGTLIAGEVYLDAIPAKRASGHMRTAFAPPALQPVTRDFAFLVPADRAADDLVRAVKGADKAAIVDARLFDVFTGAGVPEGQKSLAIEVTLQPGEKSFTDADLQAIAARVVAAATKIGATLRA
ncbi:phenylalanine--tRNA ligase subunit beta [Edaphosphingomonas haloaromaticamans]|uniref:Phenylalanine--tRNA ligase beta subunit n=1 Tax=Edaphosphingomonas haloaromaticamans TaxID=653954 RepID=A0A1S1H9W0_9SPHN|nr:phenylalanine--tRNA ligase subunit beta [Sphingomonas haloaromaticamans]OHT18436.1 Phenylalanine--tRNA ligase beta subunit [Sphingomonas haloaromaticamans]